MTGFVPARFSAPTEKRLGELLLLPLAVEYNDADYHAWMTSLEHVRRTPGFGDGCRFGDDWPPPDGWAYERNRPAILLHERDFQENQGFTYSVFESSSAELIGCVYIYPPVKEGTDVHVRSWVRKDFAEWDARLAVAVRSWLLEEWPFNTVDYEGRETATGLPSTAGDSF